MKSYLFIGLSLILWKSSNAFAEVEAHTLIRQYDDGQTQVTSPSAEISSKAYHDSLRVGVGWSADIVSSASADVRSFGSKGQDSRIGDRRSEYDVNSELTIPDGSINMNYTQSDENDYGSKSITAGGTRELFSKNTVVGFNFTNGQDQIMSSSNKAFHESMNNQVYTASLTQILSRKSLINIIYDFRVESGYISSPYREAIFIDKSHNVTVQPENHPKTRNRNAIAIKHNYYLTGLKSALNSSYRFYFDSWNVRSHTIEEKLNTDWSKSIRTSFILRYYHQDQANFYAPTYSSSDSNAFWTGNKTLSNYDSYLVGFKPTFKFSEDLSIYAKFEFYVENYKNAYDPNSLSYNDITNAPNYIINAHVMGLGMMAKF